MSDLEQGFHQALHDNPADETTWLALSDWLEENGQLERAELVRLIRQVRVLPVTRRARGRMTRERRIAELLLAGHAPPAVELVNSVGMRLALVPAGRFRRGSPGTEDGRWSDEGPAHEMEMPRPFYLGVFQVTQGEYLSVTKLRPAHFSAGGAGRGAVSGLDTSRHPIENVSWQGAVRFCELLSELPAELRAERTYRLPTEAEWEFACRGAGCHSLEFTLGPTLSSLQANCDGNFPYGAAPKGPYLERTCPVGQFLPNALGLYDVHGNVMEWVHDWFSSSHYQSRPAHDDRGPESGEVRVTRGGSWYSQANGCRSAFRGYGRPDQGDSRNGFRVLLEHPSAR